MDRESAGHRMYWDAAVRAGRAVLRVRMLCAALVAAVGIAVAAGTTDWRVGFAVLGLLLAVDTWLADAAAREAYRAAGPPLHGEVTDLLRQHTAALLHRRRVRALGWSAVVLASWVVVVATAVLLVGL